MNIHYVSYVGMAIIQIFGPDSDSYQEFVKKMADSGFLFLADSGFKKLSATYVLKINVLGVLYNSLPKSNQILKDFICNDDNLSLQKAGVERKNSIR